MTPLTSRLAAVALLVFVVASVAGFVVWPVVQTYLADRDELGDIIFRSERFRRLSTQVEPLEAELARLNADRSLTASLFNSPSGTLAAAELQTRLKRVIERSGGRLTSTQVLAPELASGFERVAVSARLSLSGSALQRVLHELEGGLPVLIVDDVIVSARPARRARRNSRSKRAASRPAPSAEINLDVRFRLSGFMPARPADGA